MVCFNFELRQQQQFLWRLALTRIFNCFANSCRLTILLLHEQIVMTSRPPPLTSKVLSKPSVSTSINSMSLEQLKKNIKYPINMSKFILSKYCLKMFFCASLLMLCKYIRCYIVELKFNLIRKWMKKLRTLFLELSPIDDTVCFTEIKLAAICILCRNLAGNKSMKTKQI